MKKDATTNRWNSWFLGLGLIAVVVCTLASAWYVFLYPIRSADIDKQNDEKRVRIQACGGAFAVCAALLALIKLRHAQQDLDIKRKTEFTTRYLKAAELLGSMSDSAAGKLPNLEARLGVIFMLDSLAIESPEDRSPIMHVLAKYVVVSAGKLSFSPPAGSSSPGEPSTPIKVRVDVQAAMEALARPVRKLSAAQRPRLDLRKTTLNWLELPAKSCLEGALLDNALLEGAQLEHVVMRGAELQFANLRHAKLAGADLRDASLVGADLEDADLSDANVAGAKFYDEAYPRSERENGLTPEMLRKARNWESALLSPEFREATLRPSELSASAKA